MARWGREKAQRQVYLQIFLEILLGRPEFPWGARVAYTEPQIARDVGCCVRTARRLIARLRSEVPGLVRVHWIAPGEEAYDGEAARVGHYEFSLGRDLEEQRDAFLRTRARAQKDAPEVSRTPPLVRKTKVVPMAFARPGEDTASPDYVQTKPPIPNLNFRSARPSCAGSQKPGVRPRRPVAPRPHTTPTARKGPERRPAPPAVPKIVRAVIEQHRRVAEKGKGPWVPISAQEIALIEAARRMLPRMSDQAWLHLCLKISKLAKAKSEEDTATLAYAFKEYFLEYVSEVRERAIAARKRTDAEAFGRIGQALGFAADESPDKERMRRRSVERVTDGEASSQAVPWRSHTVQPLAEMLRAPPQPQTAPEAPPEQSQPKLRRLSHQELVQRAEAKLDRMLADPSVTDRFRHQVASARRRGYTLAWNKRLADWKELPLESESERAANLAALRRGQACSA